MTVDEGILMDSGVPVVVVGAGPAGLAAAAHLVERGLDPVVLEAGDQVGAAVWQWRHVRLFSPWGELIDDAAARLLESAGWDRPDPALYPTGEDWAERYLEPLAKTLGERVRLGTRVVGVARRGRDRIVDAGRESEPLTVHTLGADGIEGRITARAVIDASGTWGTPNPLGGDGLPAIGEHAAADRITYRVPDLADERVASRYRGRHVAVVGSGHSALTALVTLTSLSPGPSTHVTWVLRRGQVGNVFGGGQADALAARGALGQRARAAVEDGNVDVVTGFRTAAVERSTGTLTLMSDDNRRVDDLDEVVVLTGFRPDLSWLSEIRLDLDASLQAPVALAPLIDPNVHSCGSVPPHGAAELAHPERGFYLVGMKSYGRAPTFLALTGYEQVRSVVAEIAGDREAAARVDLQLPETGVCGGSGLFDESGQAQSDGCCAAAQVITLPAPSLISH
ncbi:MAG TPA: FAD-dependent oxidoreductase [Jiangellaceae bacterium]|jgi:thioredoxin reductase|nr:FAD-dependent oxidoreductase [Jiangellaceae bacterium]